MEPSGLGSPLGSIAAGRPGGAAARTRPAAAATASFLAMPRPVWMATVCALVLALAGCGSSASSSTSGSASGSSATTASNAPTAGGSMTAPSAFAGQPGFEGVPIEAGPLLAPASTTQTAPVHGITCGASEQLAYHIHVHLQVYVDGAPRALPGGVGIPGSAVEASSEGPVAAGGSCLYWLHTHAPDGVVHIESPTRRLYTLGDFFAVWHQPLTSAQVAGAPGQVTALVDGRRWSGAPSAIPLHPHEAIQLDVGHPTPPFHPVSWAGTGL